MSVSSKRVIQTQHHQMLVHLLPVLNPSSSCLFYTTPDDWLVWMSKISREMDTRYSYSISCLLPLLLLFLTKVNLYYRLYPNVALE
jgi:hypothetical protein